eukprot:gene11137-1993_t
MLVVATVVLFAFWRPLFAGATLSPVDQVWGIEPFASEASDVVQIEAAPPDAAAIHAGWVDRAVAWRSGDFSFWDHDVAGGVPVFRDGVPFTHLLYVVVPGWFAPGLVAAVAMTVAILGARDLARRRGASEFPALFAGVAYGCSGLLFVWFGWPHATALALVPWLWSTAIVAARTRRPGPPAAAFAAVLAALLWCGVFSIAVVVAVITPAAAEIRMYMLGEDLCLEPQLAEQRIDFDFDEVDCGAGSPKQVGPRRWREPSPHSQFSVDHVAIRGVTRGNHHRAIAHCGDRLLDNPLGRSGTQVFDETGGDNRAELPGPCCREVRGRFAGTKIEAATHARQDRQCVDIDPVDRNSRIVQWTHEHTTAASEDHHSTGMVGEDQRHSVGHSAIRFGDGVNKTADIGHRRCILEGTDALVEPAQQPSEDVVQRVDLIGDVPEIPIDPLANRPLQLANAGLRPERGVNIDHGKTVGPIE